MMHTEPQLLDENSHDDIAAIARFREKIKLRFAKFANLRDVPGSTLADDTFFTVDPALEDDRIDFTYAGTRIRFSLLVGVQNQTVLARVIVMHCYNISGKESSHALGDFTIDGQGRTSFSDASSRVQYIDSSADMIVASYFAKAFANNRTLTGD